MAKPKVTLFLTTYNWPEALNLCLQSISQQTHLPDEVIVADDGSGNETKNVIEQFQKSFRCSLVHVWQEDKGFRINSIRNKAISKASHPYIIQIDGDIILDKNFVKDHLHFAKKNRFIAGRRLRLSEEETLRYCTNNNYPSLKSFRSSIIATIHHYVLYNSSSVRGIRGCNMSYWKEDAIKINGFDEDWTGKGPDDKEFAIRMVHSGVKIFNLKFYTNQHHLFHGEEGLLDNYKLNQGLLAETINNRRIRCKNGLVK